VIATILEYGDNLIIKKPVVIDKFEKEGRISLAIRTIFQSYDRTLKDDEIILIMDKITEKLKNFGFEIR